MLGDNFCFADNFLDLELGQQPQLRVCLAGVTLQIIDLEFQHVHAHYPLNAEPLDDQALHVMIIGEVRVSEGQPLQKLFIAEFGALVQRLDEFIALVHQD